jgi:hypothetical protein
MTGLIFALMLGATGAWAQGGPGEKEHGAQGMHEQGPGAAGMRGDGPGPGAQERAGPRGADRGEQPSSRGERESGKHAQQNREEKANKGRAEKGEQTQHEDRARAEKEKKGQAEERAAEKSRDEKQKGAQPSSEGQASGEAGRATERNETQRTGKEAKTIEGKEKAKSVELSGDKRDRVKTALHETPSLKHKTNVHVDLSVGHRLPRDFDFVAVPRVVVDIVPEYRDYLFAYVDDDYVICDPDTYEIVAVIPATGGPTYARGESTGRCSERLSLNADDRDLVVRAIEREGPSRKVDVSHLTIGWSVPRDVELQRFPDRVVSQVGELSSCRYFVAENQIAVVNPDEDKVVLVLDRS